MSPIVSVIVWVAMLVVGMLFAMDLGRYLRGIRGKREEEPDRSAAVEGAAFALFGLLVAFTFTGAASRYEWRRQLIVEETNAIGTAWLRLDLLPAESQPPLQELMRQYLDERLALYKVLPDRKLAEQHEHKAVELQKEIWRQARQAVARDGRPQTANLVVPSLNEVFDLGTTRVVALTTHVPALVIAMLLAMACVAALLVGYGNPPERKRNWLHRLVFVVISAVTVYVILDLEHPRAGFLRLDDADWPLIEQRKSMDAD